MRLQECRLTWQTADAGCGTIGQEDAIQLSQADLLLHKISLGAFSTIDEVLCIVECDEQTQLRIERRSCQDSNIPRHSARLGFRAFPPEWRDSMLMMRFCLEPSCRPYTVPSCWKHRCNGAETDTETTVKQVEVRLLGASCRKATTYRVFFCRALRLIKLSRG